MSAKPYRSLLGQNDREETSHANCTRTLCKRELQQDDMGSKRFRSLLFSRFGGTCVMLASCLGVNDWSTSFLAACTMRATTQATFRTSRCKIAFSYRGVISSPRCANVSHVLWWRLHWLMRTRQRRRFVDNNVKKCDIDSNPLWTT